MFTIRPPLAPPADVPRCPLCKSPDVDARFAAFAPVNCRVCADDRRWLIVATPVLRQIQAA